MMNKDEILDYISEGGGFDNFRHWNESQIATWVKSYFECKTAVANAVAKELVK